MPLTCHGHSRPITHISFSSPPSASTSNTSTTPQTPSHNSRTDTPPPQTTSYQLISACKDNNPMLRDGSTGDWIGTFLGHKGAVWSCRLSYDASLAVTGSADFSARIWDTFSGSCLAELPHNHIVRSVAFPGENGGKERVATGGMEKRVRVWDLSRLGQNNTTTTQTNGPGSAKSKSDETSSFEVGALSLIHI